MPTSTTEIQVTKRSGEVQDISFDKILVRIKKLGVEANITQVNYTLVAMKVIEQLFDTMQLIFFSICISELLTSKIFSILK